MANKKIVIFMAYIDIIYIFTYPTHCHKLKICVMIACFVNLAGVKIDRFATKTCSC